ncbi:DUF4388 domain-containing protein [Myxococcota bacterium]|nr:DUF4388 domain-containing protein [Myxococcota bacterium]
MSGSLNGEIQEFGIADVLQWIGQHGKSGTLYLRREKQALEIHFDRGRIACALPESARADEAFAKLWIRCGGDGADRMPDAMRAARASALELPDWLMEQCWASEAEVVEIRDLLTRENLFEAMQWTSGSFAFEPVDCLQVHSGRAPVSVEQALMEGLRILDEWRVLQPRLKPPETIFRWIGDPLAFDPADLRIDSAVWARMIGSIDGKRAMCEVVDLCRAGTFEGNRILDGLLQYGAIEPVACSDRASSFKRGPSAWTWVGRCLDVGVPLLLLAAIAWATFGAPRSFDLLPGDLPGHQQGILALDRRPLQWLRSSYASLAARRAETASEISLGVIGIRGDDTAGPVPGPLAVVPGQS